MNTHRPTTVQSGHQCVPTYNQYIASYPQPQQQPTMKQCEQRQVIHQPPPPTQYQQTQTNTPTQHQYQQCQQPILLDPNAYYQLYNSVQLLQQQIFTLQRQVETLIQKQTTPNIIILQDRNNIHSNVQ